MYISRLVVRNFRNFEQCDVDLCDGATCIVGENNSGKSNLLYAIRLVLDQSLPNHNRLLTEDDVHSGCDISNPSDVVISVEFRDWADSLKASALVGEWEVEPDRARLTFRFRPRKAVRDDLEGGETQPGTLSMGDYGWELRGGGAVDPMELTWHADTGNSPRPGHLQAFQVSFLHPLRDVERDLRAVRTSPLNRILDVVGIPDAEKETLVTLLAKANERIAASRTVTAVGKDISSSFGETAGPASQLDLKLGVAAPSFSTVTRALRVLLSDSALSDFDTSQNGLGLNNVLYISMLLQYFEARAKTDGVAGQLLLVEEPEAHLHPQLQRTLYDVLAKKEFQSILTTHSTHVTSKAKLDSVVTLARTGARAVSVAQPGRVAGVEAKEIADLERYLDATRSTLLYARAVMLVEGPAELFLLPELARSVMGKDLDREGVSVIPIYGTHFAAYAPLFRDGSMKKRCAIVGDKDLKPSDADDAPDPARVAELLALQSDTVRVFLGETTFERELAIAGMVDPLLLAAKEFNATSLVAEAEQSRQSGEPTDALAERTLATARRVGKARFAQALSKHVGTATAIPEYVKQAVDFLVGE